MSDIRKGTVVQLKSGGPDMTVLNFEWIPVDVSFSEENVNCAWFDGNQVQKELFPIDALIIKDIDTINE